MTTLITGGTGKTGLILAQFLTDAGHPALLTSRKGEAPAPFKAVAFNWFDPNTFSNPFTAEPSIDRVYIVAPPSLHPGPIVKPFIDLAIAKGVKRFVLLGGGHQTPKSISTGEIEKILVDSGVDYAVLKATWFQENFGTNFLHSIREDSTIRTSMADGLAPFVSTRDIADAAFDSLTVPELGKKEFLIYGPELLTYDDAVKQLSSVLGREITHTRLSVEQLTDGYIKFGFPEDFARFFVSIEQGTLSGIDKRQFDDPSRKKWIGKISLLDYFKANKDLWIKA